MMFGPRKRLPILMYHQVSTDRANGLTIPADSLEMQLAWIAEKGYSTISFRELLDSGETGQSLPARPVILTFDDAYADFYSHAWPLLKRARMKATLFVPVAFIGKTNLWDQGKEPILSADQLKELYRQGDIEFGIHSFLHRSYASLAPEDMKEDLDNCFQTLEFHGIRAARVLAYPYGGYPRKDPELNRDMKALFRSIDLWYAVRIGNRINPLPVRDRYEMKRIDIRGTDSFLTFKIKLARGFINPFA